MQASAWRVFESSRVECGGRYGYYESRKRVIPSSRIRLARKSGNVRHNRKWSGDGDVSSFLKPGTRGLQKQERMLKRAVTRPWFSCFCTVGFEKPMEIPAGKWETGPCRSQTWSLEAMDIHSGHVLQGFHSMAVYRGKSGTESVIFERAEWPSELRSGADGRKIFAGPGENPQKNFARCAGQSRKNHHSQEAFACFRKPARRRRVSRYRDNARSK